MPRHGRHTQGWIRCCHVDVRGVASSWTAWVGNLRLAEGMSAVARLLQGSPDGRPYHLRTVYIEFENNNGQPVVAPSFGIGDGRSYYDSLASHATRDYLRVPVVSVSLGSSDSVLYPRGNRLTYFAQTAGLQGVHGKPFNETVQSRVYGCALVSSPSDTDPTQDLVFARAYYPAAQQMIKTVGKQIGIEWRVDLTL